MRHYTLSSYPNGKKMALRLNIEDLRLQRIPDYSNVFLQVHNGTTNKLILIASKTTEIKLHFDKDAGIPLDMLYKTVQNLKKRDCVVKANLFLQFKVGGKLYLLRKVHFPLQELVKEEKVKVLGHASVT